VLEHVRERKTKGVTLLFLRSTDQAIDGVVSVWNARFVTSAQLYRSDLIGYDALKQLFTLATGEFAYGKPENEEIEGLEHELNIELKSLIPILPFLPENLHELFDQDSLLDNVFAPKFDPVKPSQLKVPAMDSSGPGRMELGVWKFFRSLISSPKSEKKTPPPQMDWHLNQAERQADPRSTLRLNRKKWGKGGIFRTLINFLNFWTRSEFLVISTALITSIGLLWLCEKLAPYVEAHLKEMHLKEMRLKSMNPFHLKVKLPGKDY
jgi:hypothetical protein